MKIYSSKYFPKALPDGKMIVQRNNSLYFSHCYAINIYKNDKVYKYIRRLANFRNYTKLTVLYFNDVINDKENE